jgi:hypothetical protein
MKTRTLVSILILILAVLIIVGSCATKRKAVSDEDFFEVWSGTWINTDYGGDICQKIINYPDGTAEGFGILTSTIALFKKKITILDQWLDSKGTIWYRGHCEFSRPFGRTRYEMGKISDSGNTWEYIIASEDYPIEEWEPDKFEYEYRIYYVEF